MITQNCLSYENTLHVIQLGFNVIISTVYIIIAILLNIITNIIFMCEVLHSKIFGVECVNTAILIPGGLNTMYNLLLD